jgi:hypothetical protein
MVCRLSSTLDLLAAVRVSSSTEVTIRSFWIAWWEVISPLQALVDHAIMDVTATPIFNSDKVALVNIEETGQWTLDEDKVALVNNDVNNCLAD